MSNAIKARREAPQRTPPDQPREQGAQPRALGYYRPQEPAREPQRQRQGALLTLGGMGASGEAADLKLELVTMGSDRCHTAAEILDTSPRQGAGQIPLPAGLVTDRHRRSSSRRCPFGERTVGAGHDRLQRL